MKNSILNSIARQSKTVHWSECSTSRESGHYRQLHRVTHILIQANSLFPIISIAPEGNLHFVLPGRTKDVEKGFVVPSLSGRAKSNLITPRENEIEHAMNSFWNVDHNALTCLAMLLHRTDWTEYATSTFRLVLYMALHDGSNIRALVRTKFPLDCVTNMWNRTSPRQSYSALI